MNMSAGGGARLSLFARRAMVAVLLGGAIGSALALPRVFESGQRPVTAPVIKPGKPHGGFVIAPASALRPRTHARGTSRERPTIKVTVHGFVAVSRLVSTPRTQTPTPSPSPAPTAPAPTPIPGAPEPASPQPTPPSPPAVATPAAPSPPGV